jgi:cell division septation protein DedD
LRDELDIPMPAMGPASYRTPRRRPGLDPNTRRLALIAGGIGGALVLLVGAWSFTAHRHAGLPVVEAAKGPVRVKPENPGGMAVAGENDAILSGQDGDSAIGDKTAIAPAPEVPEPQALKAQEQKAAAAAAPPAPAPAPVAAAPAPVAPAVAAVAPPEPKPAPARPAAVAKAAPAPVGHGPAVQLAALGSEEAARTEWQRLAHKLPEMLGGRKPEVSRIEHDGKTFWRLRTGGFANVAAAESFCDKAKARGVGCAVASF